ncbi:hypothetical protein [Algoriphagus marincola]|jgi:drug/metabolite transporter (DMT)-like permease|uniref:hypothetical protein n=1 Tax=Algoriphagus marincola TaxID=264027 RepID=UPI00047DEE5A|nr:hypothetical protein [Algoriphagus marincola]
MNELNERTFKFSNKGIHLTRNKFTYRFISFRDVEKVVISNGRATKNWIVVLLMGLLLQILLFFILYYIITGFSEAEGTVRFYNILGYSVIACISIGGLSYFCIHYALKTVDLLKISVGGKIIKLRILDNKENLSIILDFLKKHRIPVSEK